MPDQENPTLTPEQIHNAVARRLAKTFDDVAKEAMQAAAMARDPSVPFLEKIYDAHGRVTLIVETAMRGLGKANRGALIGIAKVAIQQDEDDEDNEME